MGEVLYLLEKTFQAIPSFTIPPTGPMRLSDLKHKSKPRDEDITELY